MLLTRRNNSDNNTYKKRLFIFEQSLFIFVIARSEATKQSQIILLFIINYLSFIFRSYLTTSNCSFIFLKQFPAFHYNLFFQKRIFIAIGARVLGLVTSGTSATREFLSFFLNKLHNLTTIFVIPQESKQRFSRFDLYKISLDSSGMTNFMDSGLYYSQCCKLPASIF